MTEKLIIDVGLRNVNISQIIESIDTWVFDDSISYWDNTKSSLFIESLFFRLPGCFNLWVDERSGIKTFVVDGSKRLFSLYNFFQGAYSLHDMSHYTEKNGMYFNDLPTDFQRRLKEYPVQVYAIQPNTSESGYNSILYRIKS